MAGTSGLLGLPGFRGEPGFVGPEGPVGQIGQQGDRGMAGDTGVAGPVGQPGPAGPLGDPGNAGVIGIPGRAGSTGSPGRPVILLLYLNANNHRRVGSQQRTVSCFRWSDSYPVMHWRLQSVQFYCHHVIVVRSVSMSTGRRHGRELGCHLLHCHV